jgi:hypothetical protein
MDTTTPRGTQYPEIWDRSGKREIIGETNLSWLVKPQYNWEGPIKVAKKNPNKNRHFPQWFFTEEEYLGITYAARNKWKIAQSVDFVDDWRIIRQIADLIGYDEEPPTK